MGGAHRDRLLDAGVRVPEHVVRRAFSDETVVLNLDTGVYHGLNPVAATMLDALEACPTVGDAVQRLSGEFDAPRDVIERDVMGLCRSLKERGLVECDVGNHG